MSEEPTVVMEAAAREEARQLSLCNLRPPLRVPGYEQEQFLGRGSFGEVWTAVNSNNGRRVAIKFYHRRGGLDWSLLSREVDKLRHLFTDRHVVQLLEVGWDSDPPYYVMEYMENGSLEQALAEGPLEVARAVGVFREVAVGLVHAHNKGILHCDLKPANVMLDGDGRPRLADFGQARLTHEESPALGTLFYMAPEQADLKALPDARWDVYALGALFYRLVVGEAPYRGAAGAEEVSKPGKLEERLANYRHLLQGAPRPEGHRSVPGVDRALGDIVARCLAVSPHERYPNVQAVLSALDQRVLRQSRRPLLVLGALAPAAVMLIMSGIAASLFRSFLGEARDQVLERAVESNQFAARAEAERFGQQMLHRWMVLRTEANNQELRRWLGAMTGAAEAVEAAPSQALNAWLRERHESWDRQAPWVRASLWFVDDRYGFQRASSEPPRDGQERYWTNRAFLDKYFGFRDYFHGLGRNYPEAPLPHPVEQERFRPLREPHRSVVYRRKGNDAWTVAYSMPVWAGEEGQGEPIGILGMTTDLGGATRVKGSRERFSVLIDRRPDAVTEQPGLIIRHPYQDDLPEGSAERFLAFHNPEAARLESAEDFRGKYLDPVGARFPAYSQEWLASVAPVRNPGGVGDEKDPGWVMLVQEPYEAAVRPVNDLKGSLRRAGALAAALVALVVTGLWGFVLFVLNAAPESRVARFLRRRAGLGSSRSLSSGSASGSHPLSASARTGEGPGTARGQGEGRHG